MLARPFALAAAFAIFLHPLSAHAQSAPAAKEEWVTVHSDAIAGNLEGNDANRDVLVVLPASYETHPEARYPVVYFLHGYLGTPKGYDEYLDFSGAVAGAEAEGNELIMVVPDGNSKHGGAMYSNSPTTGNFEDFVTHELVSYVDENYRTIAEPQSRGLAGHSMGGYGTLRLGMKYPGIFSSLYAMSACCLSQRPLTLADAKEAEANDGTDDENMDFLQRSTLAVLASWSPDPAREPNYIDTGIEGDALDPLVIGRMAANAPLVMMAQYVPALKSYEAIALDVGDEDNLYNDNNAVHGELSRFNIAHDWEVYSGDHGNRIAERLRSKVLPFFGEHLDRSPAAKSR
ncbi:esterase [Altererythrobacter endophyticus]|uniref:Esterase n=2 Tax=Altericroceibacterium endophyticum TaxID=1808508 RepID=A0A6I4T6N8_9SPHN|nr:esterase [Altericroceibacterium endophyticum]